LLSNWWNWFVCWEYSCRDLGRASFVFYLTTSVHLIDGGVFEEFHLRLFVFVFAHLLHFEATQSSELVTNWRETAVKAHAAWVVAKVRVETQ
jgi:hypothetical protein